MGSAVFWDGRVSGLEAQAVFPLTDQNEMGQGLAESVKKLEAKQYYLSFFKQAFGTSVTEVGILKALAQFQRTLISADSPYDRYLAGTYDPSESELRGMALFHTRPDREKGIRGADCAQCHGGPKMYKELFHSNGLDSVFLDKGRWEVTADPTDLGRFRVVTLRNIELSAPYMHDGRHKTLEDVLDHYSDHVHPNSTLGRLMTGTDSGKRQLALDAAEKTDIIAFLKMLTDTVFIRNPDFSNPHNP